MADKIGYIWNSAEKRAVKVKYNKGHSDDHWLVRYVDDPKVRYMRKNRIFKTPNEAVVCALKDKMKDFGWLDGITDELTDELRESYRYCWDNFNRQMFGGGK